MFIFRSHSDHFMLPEPLPLSPLLAPVVQPFSLNLLESALSPQGIGNFFAQFVSTCVLNGLDPCVSANTLTFGFASAAPNRRSPSRCLKLTGHLAPAYTPLNSLPRPAHHYIGD